MRTLLLAFCLFIAYANSAQHDHPSWTDDHTGLVIPAVSSYSAVNFDNDALRKHLDGSTELPFNMDLGDFGVLPLLLEEHDLLGNDYQIQTHAGFQSNRRTIQTLKGYTTSGGIVRMTIAPHFTYGFIQSGDETYWIEPAWYYMEDKTETDEIIIYKQSDVNPEHEMGCGADETARRNESLRPKVENLRGESRLGQCYQLELAIASDFSMYSKYGSSTVNVENHNVAVINTVEPNYTSEFDDDVQFKIVTQFISTCSTCDPWSATTDAEDLLEDFSLWGQGGNFMVNFGLGELWTNRDFDGPTVGIAWVGGLCGNFKYHCLQDYSTNAAILRVTTAHEIGHNFNAIHAPSANFIMSPVVNITSDWHPTSVSDVSDFIDFRAGQGCFNPCPAGNAPIPAMEPLANNICTGTTIKFFDRSTNDPTSWTWIFPGGTPGSSTQQYPSVRYDISGTYQVILTVANGAGSTSQTFNNAVTVGSNGTALPLYIDFDDGFNGWSVDNPDNSRTWDIFSPQVAPGGTLVARMQNFDYPAIGQRDAVISPIFSLAGYQLASLNIEYAYAARTSGQRDSLIVYISGDGGQSYQRVYQDAENGSGNVATRTPLSGTFNPASFNSWCSAGTFGAACLSLDMSAYLGSRDVLVRIENYTNSGNNLYLDRVYVSSNCFNLPPPQADFSAIPQSGCSPHVVQFQDLSTNSPFRWQWSFQNGSPATSIEQNPEVIYSTPGVYSVTLTVENESGVDVEVQNGFITVLDNPVAAFSASANGNIVTFQNLSVGAMDYFWDFGDGGTSVEENPVHTYMTDGTYSVTLTVSNDCGTDDIVIDVVVGTPPTASYTAVPLSGCIPLEVHFISTSSANTTAIQWFFEGGNPATSNSLDPIVTYDTPGTYDVTLIALNGNAADTLIDVDVIVVEDDPVASFTSVVDNLTVMFTNTSTGGGNYSWDFGDGNTSSQREPVHTYATENLYTVTLIASNQCGSDTTSQSIGLGAFPSAIFSSDITSGCAPITVIFNADAVGPNDNVTWFFQGGNPATAMVQNPVVEYQTPGTYDVTCIVSNTLGADTNLVIGYITADGPPVPDFDITSDGFLTLSITYTGEPYTSILWEFDDGSTSSDENPTYVHTQAGYEVTCIVSNACGADTLTQELFFTDPLVMVSGYFDPHCVGDTVNFTALGGINNNLNYEWQFEGGDPAMATGSTPSVTYLTSGIYDFTLTASLGAGSITYEFLDEIIIENEPIAGFIQDLNILMNTSMHATTFEWFVDGEYTTDSEDLNFPGGGTYEVDLVASNSCGADTFSQVVLVSATADLPTLNKGMNILPNPNNGHFTLAFDRPIGTYELSIINIQGQEVHNAEYMNQGQQLDKFDLSTGMYLIRATTSDGIFVSKMVVTR